MNPNINMKSLLSRYSLNSLDSIPLDNTYPLWHKTDNTGERYWGVGSFYELDKFQTYSGHDLSLLEWDANEVYLNAKSDEETADILKQMVGIIAFWKSELETRYPETPFYIFASYDNGDMLIMNEDESPQKSVTLRFWADRGNYPVINLDYFEHWDQPAIIERCNFVPLSSK